MPILTRKFFNRDTLIVARELLGKKLIREKDGRILSGMIVETEAYIGSYDTACHASKGQTPRNSVMFGMSGIAYIYFVYGMHYMFNVVTESENNPCAVLIRSILPIDGQEFMEKLRNKRGKELSNGPAKLTSAMAIDKSLNGLDLTEGKMLWIEDYKTISDNKICTGPRIGIQYAALKDREAPWRFWADKESLS